jgi:hypothetical protein
MVDPQTLHNSKACDRYYLTIGATDHDLTM